MPADLDEVLKSCGLNFPHIVVASGYNLTILEVCQKVFEKIFKDEAFIIPAGFGAGIYGRTGMSPVTRRICVFTESGCLVFWS